MKKRILTFCLLPANILVHAKRIGESKGLDKMNTIEKKQEFEKKFMDWVEGDNIRKSEYGSILPEFKKLYSPLKD